jgi:alpha,alpha-trehalase
MTFAEMEIIRIENLGELFTEVQMKKIFPDGKTFTDCLPKFPLPEINEKYFQEKNSSSFDLQKFVEENFTLPKSNDVNFESDTTRSIKLHIKKLQDALTRQPADENSSLIKLPFPYIVPGGRFSEIYYWDSYFTMLGLQASGRVEMIENMVANFAFLIDTFGYIPNGNRSYFLGRSQPPFFSLMIEILADEKENILIKYLPQLLKEYDFWMKGKDEIDDVNKTSERVVKMPDGSFLNRYWDENDTPRAESYKEDIELAEVSKTNSNILFRNIRAACESGWDFSCRWFKDISSFTSIHTTEIIPVDLNCLLFHLEKTLSEIFDLQSNKEQSSHFLSLAEKRKAAIEKYCCNEELGFYFDYDIKKEEQKSIYTMAAVFPLFFNIASNNQAAKVSSILNDKFLKIGGFVTTPETSGQQWDAPNGWAPLQWIAIQGLRNYGLNKLAKEAAMRWIKLNKNVYRRTGKLMEKYNVVDENLDAGGGEYPAQDGFGWTNGVLLKLMDLYDVNE